MWPTAPWDVPASIMNQKLWAKLVIVAILTLNALLLHGIVLPRVVSRVGQPLFETSFGWLSLISTLFGAVSAVSWTFAAYLGLARELNGHANLMPILGSYLIALLLTWVAAVILSHLLRHRGCKPHPFQGVVRAWGNWGKTPGEHDLLSD